MLKLQKLIGGVPQSVLQFDVSTITIGREPENTLVVDSDAVSRQHSYLTRAGENWIYVDLGSSNGSWVNGVPVKGGQKRLIRNGDIIQLANFAVSVASGAEGRGSDRDSALKIFTGDEFQKDISVSIVGQGGHFALTESGASFTEGIAESAVASIERTATGIILRVSKMGLPIFVNGSTAYSELRLVDRDEVCLRDCAVVVNDPSSVQTLPGENLVTEGLGSGEADAYDRVHRPAHLQPRDEGWESESVRRRMESGRKFVFGSAASDKIDVSQTQMLKSVPVQFEDELYASPLHRFSHLKRGDVDSGPLTTGQKVLVAVAVCILVVAFGWAAMGIFGF